MISPRIHSGNNRKDKRTKSIVGSQRSLQKLVYTLYDAFENTIQTRSNYDSETIENMMFR